VKFLSKRKTLVKVTTRVRGNAFLLSYLLAIKSTFFSSFSPCSSGPFILKKSAFSHSDQESSMKETKPLINYYVNKSHSLAEIINQDWNKIGLIFHRSEIARVSILRLGQ
jgi:hypothetical protein